MRNGPVEVELSAGIDQLPMFARSGSVVPTTSVPKHTSSARWDDLTLRVFPHLGNGESSFTLVEDDGHSTDYLKGETEDTTVTLSRAEDVLSLRLDGPGTVARSSITAAFDLPPGESVRDVMIDGRAGKFTVLPRPDGGRITPISLDDSAAMFPNSESVMIYGECGTKKVELELKKT